MNKSNWKTRYKKNFFETIENYSRNTSILPQFTNKTVKIHNGKIFVKLKITNDMIGYKFGEFSPTRKKFSYKKLKKKRWDKK